MTMWRLSALISSFCSLLAGSQVAEVPLALPKAAQTYLPAGWKVLKMAQGDLNADGMADLVFVREETDSKKITKRSDGYELNGNPRTVVVLLADKEGYRKVVEYPKFIPPAYTFEFDNYIDRFKELKVAKGVITIEFDWFASAGTWWTSQEAFKFRLEAGKLRLIGTEESSFARNQGDMTLTSTNHLTGRRKITTGTSAFDDQPSRNNNSLRVVPGVEFSPDALFKGSAKVGYRKFDALNVDIPDATYKFIFERLSKEEWDGE